MDKYGRNRQMLYRNPVSICLRNQEEAKKIDKTGRICIIIQHGYGLKNVKNIVEKNSGELVLKVEKNQFIVELRIRN